MKSAGMARRVESAWKRLRKDRRGFTLIELATVVVILGTLTTMFVENLQKTRLRAKRISCISNQRNIFQAGMLYGADNLVPAGNVNVSLLMPGDYVPQEMTECPMSQTPDWDDYDIFFVGGNPTTITCNVRGFEHAYTP